MKNKIKILHGLPPEMKRDLAEIYYEAFGEKLSIFIKPKHKALFLLEEALNTNWGFYALENNELLGFLGYEIKGNYYSDFNFYKLKKIFGLGRAAYITLAFRLASNINLKERQILVDSLAVKKHMRQRGIGTMLLNQFFRFAKRQGFHEAIIEVVNTNTKALRLYKKLGFKPIKKRKYHIFTRRLGFSASITMLKDLRTEDLKS